MKHAHRGRRTVIVGGGDNSGSGDRVREMGGRLLRAHRKFTEGMFS